MELHIFGHGALSPDQRQSPDLEQPSSEALSSTTCILRAKAIKILWLSWCDAVIAYQSSTNSDPDTDRWTIIYHGTSLTPTQAIDLTTLETINTAINTANRTIDFFGSTMHDGIRGYIILQHQETRNEVTLFATDLEIEAGIPEVQTYPMKGDVTTTAIRVQSSGHVLISTQSTNMNETKILRLGDISDLRAHLSSPSFSTASVQVLSTLTPSGWCTNATSSTAIDPKGRIHTATHDMRYPKCLGRSHEGSLKFEPTPYLSETRVKKIASGGYMTAAISEDGELFLWGQACPGTEEELDVLSGLTGLNGEDKEVKLTAVFVDEDQDDFVKLMTVRIDGRDAVVANVAVGHGYVLVAAEVQEEGGEIERRVFGAGDNSKGQLGTGSGKSFLEKFEEVKWLRDKKVVQMAAAGWTTGAIIEE
ncbi:hypothetical protein EK21DRAFT_96329 [Setomelanomma holmii]|uniref:Uncharacterized protein n=1 Tax=Setomelanomma holmii TaxID=210430 RepID=A0A9P4HLF3_9PLEO|nr:hypothetical protein EK21DRAFT_96329 [Setomelanomma holmii]